MKEMEVRKGVTTRDGRETGWEKSLEISVIQGGHCAPDQTKGGPSSRQSSETDNIRGLVRVGNGGNRTLKDT